MPCARFRHLILTPVAVRRPSTARHGAVLLFVALLCASGCGVVAHRQNADGVRQFQTGQYQAAIANFEQAIATNPGDADGYYNLASTYHRLAKLTNQPANWKMAEDTYNLCLDRNPNHRDCHRALAVLLSEEQRNEEAFRLLEGWAQKNPSSADPKIELARLSQEFGNTTQAREQLLEALAASPYDSRALVALGQLNEQTGNATQALANYQRAVVSGENSPQVQSRIAALQSLVQPTGLPTAAPGTRYVTMPASSAPGPTTSPIIR
ncbi:MAG: tetratricopeptide repeat protein [Planctomycetes bacterium]|nr:tetratricopeptide repeat protein [Planctomycetota bacterium]